MHMRGSRQLHVGLGLALVVISIAGCATTAATFNQQLLADSREPIRSLEAMALAGGAPIVVGKEMEGRLSAESAPAYINSSRAVYVACELSSYDSSSYRLQVDTDCECLGFNKTVLTPRVVVLDTAGVVVTETNTLSPRHAGWSTPGGMTGALSWQSMPGRYYIVLISAASGPTPTPAMSGTGYSIWPPGMITGIPIYGAPFGPFRLKLEIVSH
jgi:hypothetical protein